MVLNRSCSFWLFLLGAVAAGVAALTTPPQHPNPNGYYRPQDTGASDPRPGPPVGYTQTPPVLRPDDYYGISVLFLFCAWDFIFR